MIEVTIEQMNEAIARFMGGTRVLHPEQRFFNEDFYGYVCHDGRWWNEKCLKYHTSWDWIVPVYKKIKGMHLDILKQSFVMAYMHAAGPMNSAWSFVDIEKLHKGIYQFITWYNQQKQNNG